MATLFAAALLIAALQPVTASAAGADLAGLIVFQDTTVVTDSIRLQRLMRGRARRDSLARRARVADGDTLQEAGLPFPEPDSIMRALMRRQGYRPVFYQGDTLRLVPSENSIHINERAFLEREGDQLYADSVVYNSDTRYMVAFGESKLIDANGQEMVSEKGPFFYNTDRHLGTVVGGKTKWNIWNVEGNFTLEGSDTLWVNHGIFTSCENPEPHYYFQAGRMKLIFNKIVVAWPVKLYFGDTPVFWFPFFAQDIRQGRHSGILNPRFGVNDIFRQDRDYRRHISNVGYYWAINDYMDGQLSIDWWSETWFRIDTFFRYNWRRKFMTGRIGFSRFLLPDRRSQAFMVLGALTLLIAS